MKILLLVRRHFSLVADRVGSGKVLTDLLKRRVLPVIECVWDYLVIIGGCLTFLIMLGGVLARPFYELVVQWREDPMAMFLIFLAALIGALLSRVSDRKKKKA